MVFALNDVASSYMFFGFRGRGGDRRGEYGMGKGFGVKKLKFS